jgi:hypothetical protein
MHAASACLSVLSARCFVHCALWQSLPNHISAVKYMFGISPAGGALHSVATAQLHALAATEALQATAQEPAAILAQHKNSSSSSSRR